MLLLVDDDPNFLLKAERLLSFGHNVYFASDAEHARDLMTTVGADFSVVMIDLDLPGSDESGFELIRAMRRDFPDLPVIAISGSVQESVVDGAKLVGATEILHKPITPEWNEAIDRVRSRAAGA